jgi:hypothetical protein
MREVILKIPEKNFDSFKKLIQNLDFEVEMEEFDIPELEELDIPEEHKAIVRERIKAAEANPDKLLDWDEIQDKL